MVGMWFSSPKQIQLTDGRIVPEELKGIHVITKDFKQKMMEFWGNDYEACGKPCTKCIFFRNLRQLRSFAKKDDSGWYKLALDMYLNYYIRGNAYGGN